MISILRIKKIQTIDSKDRAITDFLRISGQYFNLDPTKIKKIIHKQAIQIKEKDDDMISHPIWSNKIISQPDYLPGIVLEINQNNKTTKFCVDRSFS